MVGEEVAKGMVAGQYAGPMLLSRAVAAGQQVQRTHH